MKDKVRRHSTWLGLLAALAVAVSLLACGGAPSSMETPTSDPTPTVPPAPTPTSTPIPTPTPPSAPASTVDIDEDTTWQELFSGFSSAEQDCIRAEVGGELDSLLGERVLTDDDLTDWQVSLFDCLTPEMARSVYASVLVAGMVTDETYDVSEREIECVSAWVADANVHRIIRGTAEEDLTVMGEMLSGVVPCLLDFFMPEFLAEMGVDAGTLTNYERTCLNEWMLGYDWANLMTALMEEDLGILGEFLPGLISCAPEPFLALIFEDFGVDVDALTDEEKNCLEDWLIDFDWDAVIAAMTAVAFAEEEEAYGVLAEVFGLLACVPDLPLYENVDFGGPDDYGDDFASGTPIGVGQFIEGTIGAVDDVDVFELSARAGWSYRVDVALVTLDDSVLTIHNSDGWEVAYNDDYGDGTASRIIWEAPDTGIYYIEVSGFFSTGSYILTVALQ